MADRDGTMLQIDGLPGKGKHYPIAGEDRMPGRYQKKPTATVSLTRMTRAHQVVTPSGLQTGAAGDVLVIAQDGQAWTISPEYAEANYMQVEE